MTHRLWKFGPLIAVLVFLAINELLAQTSTAIVPNLALSNRALTNGSLALQALLVDTEGAAVTSLGGGTQVAESAAFSNGTATTLQGMRNCGTTPSEGTSIADGDVSIPCLSGFGAQYTTLVLGDGTVASFATDASKSATAPSSGPLLMAEADDTSTTAVTEGNAGSLRIDLATRALFTRLSDPCSGLKSTYVVDIVTATTTEINLGGTNGAATTGNNVYICGVFLGPTSGAGNVTLVEDDTDACASPVAGLFGGVTAGEGWNIAANGGTNIGNGAATVSKTTATNRWVCFISSAAVQVSGTVQDVLAP